MSNPDVVLVRPWSPSAVPPDALVEDSLGVGYVAAVLRKAAYKVVILDAFTFQFGTAEIVRSISDLAPKVLGISLHSFADYEQTIAICDEIARVRPEMYRVLGGEHATFLAREILERHPNVDAIVMGEGEETIIEIVSRVISGECVASVLGAVVRTPEGALVDGGMRPALGDLDAVPLPVKDIVETALLFERPVAVSVLTGRGCTHKCTFCTANSFLRLGGGAVWRRRKPEAVVDEMESLIERYSHRAGVHPMIQFQDVIFLGTSPAALAWTSRFVEELEKRNLAAQFYFMARAEAIIANKDLLPDLVRVGLRSAEIGIESGVDRILTAYNKQNCVDRTNVAVELLRSNGICYDASGFIMFDPRMTLQDVRTNALFLKTIDHATWDRYVTRLQVFPGTVIRQQLIDEGLFNTDAALDDVYAYEFVDPQVGVMASQVWYYNDSIRYLDNLMRAAKSTLADRTRAGLNVDDGVGELLNLAQDIYCSHFLNLVDLVEQNRIAEQFPKQIELFLAQVDLVLDPLRNLIASEEGKLRVASVAG